VRLDLDRDLVGGTADAARANLKGGADVVESLLQNDDGILAALGGNALEGTVDDALGKALLAVKKDLVDELADNRGTVYRVGDNGALGSWSFTRHYFFFSSLAP
jgi:hypothetical protein